MPVIFIFLPETNHASLLKQKVLSERKTAKTKSFASNELNKITLAQRYKQCLLRYTQNLLSRLTIYLGECFWNPLLCYFQYTLHYYTESCTAICILILSIKLFVLYRFSNCVWRSRSIYFDSLAGPRGGPGGISSLAFTGTTF